MFDWYTAIITYIIATHIASSTFSIYVHRGLGHHYFEFGKFLSHTFRFILWFLVGFVWKNWMQHYAAMHRKHHLTSDTTEDPHSPQFYTFRELLEVSHCDPNKANYISAAEIKKFAPDITSPNDWIEHNLYLKYPKFGLVLFALIMFILFGLVGLIIGIFNYIFAGPIFIFFANYAFHKFGWTYASIDPVDKSRILCPIGIFCAGEELHAHHHNDPRKPYFKRNWYEIDLGWWYCQIFMFFGLMKVKENHV